MFWFQISHTGFVTTASWRSSKRRQLPFLPNGSSSADGQDLCDSILPSTSKSPVFAKSIDKMFEEAVSSGVLTLRQRKLKEFPVHFCGRFDLSDLISAALLESDRLNVENRHPNDLWGTKGIEQCQHVVSDLSQNRLTELPACMCELEYLETLQLKSNCIQRLPSSVHLLKSLGFLDLRGNQLKALPNTLFFLKLKVLLLSGNQIQSIPREIRQLENCLTELDVSWNKLTELPSDISLLKSLRVLNVANNKLTELPSEIGHMQLRILDISENSLSAIPVEFCNLSGFVAEFKVGGNPLVAPPVNVVEKGREHIFKWLRTKLSTESNGYKSYSEWAFSRCSNINATLRRPDRIQIDRSQRSSEEKKQERRPRQSRFNTLGGSDSGYTSTGDSEHRLSNGTTNSKGSLEEINERCRSDEIASTPSTDRSGYLDGCSTSSGNSSEISGDLAKEVMLAYAETVIEKKIAARNSPLSPNATLNNNTIMDVSIQSVVLDISNNNIPSKTVSSPRAPLAVPETSRTEANSNLKVSDVSARAVEDITQAVKELNVQVANIQNPQKNQQKKSPLQSMERNQGIKKTAPVTVAKKTTPPPRAPATTNRPARSTSIGLKKPSLSTSRIAPAPSVSSISTAGRKSDPVSSKRTTTSVSNLAASRQNLTSSTIETKPTMVKKSTGMSKSVTAASRNPVPTVTNGAGPSVVDTMKRILESKMVGAKLSENKDKLAQELSSGVILCNFANKIKPRSVPTVMTQTLGEQSLSPVRSKKNAESFVAACKRLGVPESSLCSPSNITDKTNLVLIAKSVLALNKFGAMNDSSVTISSVAARV
ncbi:hypothetical protein FO519_000908 [Halicephalobus sp. NKZ332]|nr:hypothetical protein FO519_000908 [Halicephalobus sp. NKZ332]